MKTVSLLAKELLMTFFDKDPKNLYRNLKERIPHLKIKNKEYMNKLHKLDMPSDFWWALSGEYAVQAEYLTILSSEDSRLLNDLTKPNTKFYLTAILSKMIKLIGIDSILDKNFVTNTNDTNKSIDELLVEDEEKNFSFKTSDPIIESLPMKHFTIFLTKLRLRKFKYLYLKIKEKIQSIYNNSDIHDNESFYVINPDKNFEKILHAIMPDYLSRYFPRWFLLLSNYLVRSKHKWVTYFGYERNIYQMILMAKSYQKYGTKNIHIISHGMISGLGVWNIYRFSLFPNLKLYNLNMINVIPKIHIQNLSNDILFCPPQFPFIQDFFSITHFQKFIKVYKSAIKLIINGLKNGSKIKIRYKNLEHLSGYYSPNTREECQIPVENKKFEEIYYKYKLIVSMPFGTISENCYQNDLNCISYNYPYHLTNKQSYLKANKYPGVFTDANKFLQILEKKIGELKCLKE